MSDMSWLLLLHDGWKQYQWSHLMHCYIGTNSKPSRRLISPFPSFMTQGSGRTFSMYSSHSLQSCTPGYQVSTLDLRNGRIQTSYVPGSCNGYDFLSGQWASTGGKLTAFCNGGSPVNVGYLLSLGGYDTFFSD